MSDHDDVLEALDFQPELAPYRWLEVTRAAMDILHRVNPDAFMGLGMNPGISIVNHDPSVPYFEVAASYKPDETLFWIDRAGVMPGADVAVLFVRTADDGAVQAVVG